MNENRLSHDEFMKYFRKSIEEILSTDHLLKDLPVDVSQEEIEGVLGVEQGHMVTITINDTRVVLSPKATVSDLKRTFRRRLQQKLLMTHPHKHISWRYIWKKYHLCFNGVKLLHDNKQLAEYGMTRACSVHFLPKVKERFYSRKAPLH